MSLSPALWERVRSLFEQAQALTAEDRDQFLHSAARHQPELRPLVEPLLGSSQPPETFLCAPGSSAFNALVDSLAAPALATGRRFAGYVVRGVLGSGATSIVYEAEQARPRRRVALKVLRGAALSGLMLRRFEHESELLARLKHPHIAQVFEAGSADTALGPQPYIAMELIRGQPITHHVRATRMSRDAKLRLFAKVCSAVHHAHQHGVVHRDIKPANVLVEENGAPKVLDFGVARLEVADEPRSQLTVAGDVVGTLAYMSPEQVSGRVAAVDTRSDVYSLGMLLYELLTGALPYSAANLSLADATRVIREAEPPAFGPRQRELQGDLETIARKALQKDPDNRYASVSALIEDLERLRRNEPILARRPTAAYYLRKLAARHAVLASLSAILLVSLIGFSAGIGVLYLRSERLREDAEWERKAALAARDSAERSRQTATAVRQFMAEIFTMPGPGEDSQVTVHEALDQAVARLDTQTSLDPEIVAAIRQDIGNGYYNLRADEPAEAQFRRAYESRLERLGADDPATASAAYDLGRTLRLLNRHAEGAALLEQALAVWRAQDSEDPERIAAALNWLAMTRKEQGDLDEAERLLNEALARADPDNRGTGGQVGLILRHLGHIHDLRGDVNEAERLYLEAAERRTAGGARFDGSHNLVSAIEMRCKRGDTEGARDLIRRWLETAVRAPEVTSPSVVKDTCAVSQAMRQVGMIDQADALLEEAAAAARGAEHPRIVVHVRSAYFSLGTDRANWSALAEAEAAFRAAGELGRGATPLEMARIQYRLGDILWQRGQWQEGAELLESALRLRRAHGEGRRNISFTLRSQGRMHLALGESQQALDRFEQALEDLAAERDDTHGEVAEMRSFVACAQAALGASEIALPLLEQSLATFQASGSRDDAMRGRILHNAACVRLAAGDAPRAEADAREAFRLLEDHFDGVDRHSPAVLNTLARALAAQGRVEEALSALEESLRRQTDLFDGRHWCADETTMLFSSLRDAE